MNASADLRGLKLTLGVYILIFAMKLVVYLMSGVMVLLAESLHALSDIFVSGFLQDILNTGRTNAHTRI